MSTWRYQCMRRVFKTEGYDDEFEYGLYEYFPSEGKGGWTKERVSPYGESYQKLKDNLELALKDIYENGVLDYETGEIIEKDE